MLRKARLVKVEGDGLVINGTPKGVQSLVFDTASIKSETQIESNGPIKIRSGEYSKRVRGKIIIKPKKNRLMVLNVLDIERYLWGVVPSESYPSWPLETLKAQAVASRTYAYYQVLHRKKIGIMTW